jgi:hypothetical protein
MFTDLIATAMALAAKANRSLSAQRRAKGSKLDYLANHELV